IMEDADGKAEGFNPFCGDRVTVYVKRGDDTLSEVSFQGSGCAICTASASMMTEAVRGRRLADAQHLFDWFHNLLTQDSPNDEAPDEQAAALPALAGVR